MENLYSLKLQTLHGKPADLSAYQGKVLLIVNTASECGFTPQYKGLEALYEKYGSQGLVVLGFPSNDFGAQEPGSDSEIQEFCDLRFRIKFPMFAKASVKGPEKQPLYAHLLSHSPSSEEVAWNFEKFLVGKNGQVLARFKSKVEPESAELVGAIEKALK